MLFGVDIVKVMPTLIAHFAFILCLSQQSWGIINFKLIKGSIKRIFKFDLKQILLYVFVRNWCL